MAADGDPLSGEEVGLAGRWRSSAGNLEVAGLPGWGAWGQRGDPGGGGPAQPQEGGVQGLCQQRSGSEPLHVGTRGHPRSWGGRSEP